MSLTWPRTRSFEEPQLPSWLPAQEGMHIHGVLQVYKHTVTYCYWYCACRKAWHRKSPAVFADTVRRMRWGEVAFGSLRTWGMLQWNFW